jgi:hypothetical protein
VLLPGDLGVWDGHVAMIDGNGVMVEAKINRGADRSPSWHRLGPRDMPLEAERCRHRAEAQSGVALGMGGQ